MPRPGTVLVDYVGEGDISVGARSRVLEPSYELPRLTTLPTLAGDSPLLITYLFDDHAIGSTRELGLYATLKVRVVDATGTVMPVAFGPASGSRGWRIAAVVSDMAIGALLLTLVVFYGSLFQKDWLWMGLIWAAYLAVPDLGAASLPRQSLVSLAVALPALAFMLSRWRSRDVLSGFFLFVAAGAVVVGPLYSTPSTVVLRPAGQDWLTYESLARSVLEDRSLAGGEAVFYYQPLFRYILFLERMLFGDGDLLVALTAYAALMFAIAWMLRRFRRPGSVASLVVSGIVGALLVALAGSSVGGLEFITSGASEYPTWIFLSAMLPCLFRGRALARRLAGVVWLGLGALTRLNHLPALLVVFAAFVARVRSDRRTLVAAAAILAALVAVPLLHNLGYGHTFELFTSSRSIPQNLVLPPSTLVAAVTDATAREAVWAQIRLLGALGVLDPGFEWGLLSIALHGLQLAWLASVGWLLATRRATLSWLLLASTPLCYLGVHLTYVVDVYYPRHILAGHFMMGAVAAALAYASLGGRTKTSG